MNRIRAIDRRRLREWLSDLAGDHPNLPARLQRHVEQCPKCRRRVGQHARLGQALRMVKSQPYPMALLLQANRKTMAHLQRRVRELPAARKLQTQLPRPSLRIRLANLTHSPLSAAACLLMLLAMRTSILSSADRVEKGSQQTVKHLQSYIDEFDPAGGSDRSHPAG
jgi:hypothetical protein